MADVFISYARADKVRVAPLVAALEAKGWSVWWDPEITPGLEFDDEIDTEMAQAKAVLVVWTPTSVASRWVRGEAREAADRGILVPVRFEAARLPMDVRAIHTTDLDDWQEDPASAPAQACFQALSVMIARSTATQLAATKDKSAHAAAKVVPHHSVCVLPFVNMSGDSEQEYFSDGITEDIITDLSKVSALSVASSNTAFRYKGQHVDIEKVARELKVTHVLEGSVRKAGGRIRINAQLIDGSNDNHVWAERYDRDASDIFAIQDEISQAIVKALKLRLLPEERKAIERRGTTNVEAHDLYLMARQIYVTSQETDTRAAESIIRLCTRITEIDPDYAQAWALMAIAYRILREGDRERADNAMVAAERALELDPNLAEAHAVKAQILQADDKSEAATAEVAIAIELGPESYEVNRAAGRINYQQHRYDEAIRHYEKAAALLEDDAYSVFVLASAYLAVNDHAGARRAAEVAFKRADAILAHDRNNAVVMVYSAYALAVLGEAERAKVRMTRAMLINPDNFLMRYNFACMLNVLLNDKDAAFEMLGFVFSKVTEAYLPYAKADPDFASLHEDPRWQAMVTAAEARLAAAKSPTPATPPQPA